MSAQDTLQRKSVYKFRLGVDIPIGLITLGTGGTSFLLKKKKKALTLDEINALQPTDVNRFDRSAIYHFNKGCKIASDVFEITSMVSPAL
jgi:hypothetical protein